MLLGFGKNDLMIVFRDTGAFLRASSFLFLVPVLVALIYFEPLDNYINYISVGVFCSLSGHVIRKVFYSDKESELKHAFLSVGVLWVSFTFFASLPFALNHGMSFLDAYFEAMSAITTTGLSVLPAIDSAPKSLLFWRSFLEWIGGIGIVVLALTGVLSTYSRSVKYMIAEGREKRIKPNLKNTAKQMIFIYAIMTLFGTSMLYFSGLDLFSAVNYSMSAISTTGTSISSQGLQGMHNYLVDFSLIVIMLLGATSFSTHYLFIKRIHLKSYLEDREFQIMLVLSAVSVVAILPELIRFYQNESVALEYAVFYAVSAITEGGFDLVPLTGDIALWSEFVKIILIIIMFIGGSSGSTTGGVKISRFWIFIKSIIWRIKSLVVAENVIFSRKFEGREVGEKEVNEINQFIILYLFFVIVGTIVLVNQGIPLGNSLFEVVSAQSNNGLSTGVTYPGMNPLVELMLIFNMWIGRLEIIPFLSALGFILAFRER